MSEYQQNHEYETAFYSLRSGEGVKEAVETLARAPEKPLNDAERENVLTFEHDLARGFFRSEAGEQRAASVMSLQEIKEQLMYGSNWEEVAGDYIVTAEGREAAARLGFTVDGITPADGLAAIRRQGLGADTEKLKELARRSSKWTTDVMIQGLVAGEDIPDFTSDKVFTSLDTLTNKLAAYRAYRQFYAQVNKNLGENESREDEAKRAIVGVYQKVINEELATIYPSALSAWDQLHAGDDDSEEAAALRAAWPQGERMSLLPAESRQEFIVGLDHIRNGTVLVDGKFSAISTKLREAVEQPAAVSELNETPRFNSIEAKALSSVTWDARRMQAFCKDILKELGLLSQERHVAHQHGRAADGKWWVVIDAKSMSLDVSDTDGLLRIPKDFSRSLTRVTAPVGAVAGAGHEITHLYQRDNLRGNQGGLELARTLQGRSSVALREAGGVYSEQQIQQELFGVVRPDAPHYLRAVEALEQGGGYPQAARAFYESYRAANPGDTREEAAKVAVFRAKRLVRYGGFDSQPLNYAQTALIVGEARQLSEEQRNQLFAEGAFDLPDMVTLHRYNLLSSHPKAFPVDKFCSIVEKELRKEYIQRQR